MGDIDGYFVRDLGFLERDEALQPSYHISNRTISDGTLTESLAQSLNPEKAKVITGNPLAHGVGPRDRSWALYDQHFVGGSRAPGGKHIDTWNHVIPQPTRDEAMREYVSSKKDYSDHARHAWRTGGVRQPKWVTRNPNFKHIWHMRAGAEVAELAAKQDNAVVRNFQFDRYLQGRRNAATRQQIEALGGTKGTLIRFHDGRLRPQMPTPGQKKVYGGQRGLMDRQRKAGPGVSNINLMLAPPPLLKDYIDKRPVLRQKISRILDEIARNSSATIPAKDAKIINNVVHQALRYGEVNRVFDPKMIYFVKPKDPTFIQSGIVRDNLERIKRVMEIFPEFIPEKDMQHVVFPLAVKLMMEHKEVDAGLIKANINPMKNLRQTLIRLRARSKTPMWGDRKYLMHLANGEDKKVLRYHKPSVIHAMAKSMDHGVTTAVVVNPQMFKDLPSGTVNIGLPWDGTLNAPKAVAGGGFMPGMRKLGTGMQGRGVIPGQRNPINNPNFKPHMRYGFAQTEESF